MKNLSRLICSVALMSQFVSLSSYAQPENPTENNQPLIASLSDDNQAVILELSVHNPADLLKFTTIYSKKVFSINTIKNAINIAIKNEKKVFDFSKQTFTDFEFRALFTGDGLFSKITKLNLSEATFTHALLSELPETLTELNLTGDYYSKNKYRLSAF